MSLQDIKKNAEFVRQLELKGIAEANLTGEPYQGTSKNMSYDEKMYLTKKGRYICTKIITII